MHSDYGAVSFRPYLFRYYKTTTGRHLWVAVYFRIETDSLAVHDLSNASKAINAVVTEQIQDCSCELILEL